jgi:hypothetical protein
MSVFLLLSLFTGIILLELPRLVRRKMRRELLVFLVLLVLGFGLSLSQLLDLPIPNPAKIIATIFRIKY